MAKDRFNPAARRALGSLSGDPMDALVQATMARRDAGAARSGAAMTADEYARMQGAYSPATHTATQSYGGTPSMSGAAMSAAEFGRMRGMGGAPMRRDAGTFNPKELRTDALAPQYDAMSEMDPYEAEPDGDADDFTIRHSAAMAGVRNNPAQWRAAESMYGQAVGAPEDPDDMTRLRDGRQMSYRDAIGQSGTTSPITMANMVDRGYTTGTQRVRMEDELARFRAMRGGR